MTCGSVHAQVFQSNLLTKGEELIELELSCTGISICDDVGQYNRLSCIELVTFDSAAGGESFTIATMAILISDRIIKLTKNPVNDNIYSTNLAGTISEKADTSVSCEKNDIINVSRGGGYW